MAFIYKVEHRAVVRGTTTITSDVELTPEQIEDMFDVLSPSPGDFVIDEDTEGYPLHRDFLKGRIIGENIDVELGD